MIDLDKYVYLLFKRFFTPIISLLYVHSKIQRFTIFQLVNIHIYSTICR